MRPSRRAAVLSTAAAALVVGASVAATTSGPAGASAGGTANTAAVGLSADGTRVTEFKTLVAGTAKPAKAVTGLVGDVRLVGIDQRVADGKIYGVGDLGGVYTLDGPSATKVSQLQVALQGTAFDIDFNPAADRLRIISDAGQSLRHDVVGGTTAVDGSTTYTTPPAVATGISAVAYTNNDKDAASATTLYDLDAQLDQLVMQVPANSGTLIVVGKLGVDFTSITGFDIDTELRGTKADRNTGYLVGRTSADGPSSIYTIDLLTGTVEKLSTFKGDVVDLAVVQG